MPVYDKPDVVASEIDADNHGPGLGGVVSLRGDGALTVRDGSTVQARARAAGHGADISVSANSISLLDGGHITSGTYGSGQGGNVEVTAGGSLFISDAGSNGMT